MRLLWIFVGACASQPSNLTPLDGGSLADDSLADGSRPDGSFPGVDGSPLDDAGSPNDAEARHDAAARDGAAPEPLVDASVPSCSPEPLERLPFGARSRANVLDICAHPVGAMCPETTEMFPSTDELDLRGETYTDVIPDTIDLATWAAEYYHGALASMLPSATINARWQSGLGGVWVPDGSFAHGSRTVFSENTTAPVNGVEPNSFCDHAPPPCIENEGVPQWPIALQTIGRAREMAGFVSPDDLDRELASLRGVFAYDQSASANLAAHGTPHMTTPFSYTLMLLSELHRQHPTAAAIRQASDEYVRYLETISHTDGTFTFWFNSLATEIGSGFEGNGGYYNNHFIQVAVHAYLGMGLLDLYRETGNPKALEFGHKAVEYLRGYQGGAFWVNPDPSRFNADGPPPFVGHTLAYIPAYNAMLADAAARIERNPADPIARAEVEQAVVAYEFMKRRGGAGLLGHFGVSSVLGQMMELGVRLQALRFVYPDLIPFGTYYEDIERWTRNQAAEIRFDASLAQYIGDAASEDNRFHNVISRSLGTFISDNAHPMMLPTFDFQDNNDGLWLMRGLYDAWHAAVEVTTTDTAWVNLALNSASQYMDVHSDIPYRGRIEVVMKPDIGSLVTLAIRVPTWAGPTVTVTEDGVELPFEARWTWNGRYVVIPAIRASGRYVVRFPMTSRTLSITQLFTQDDWWHEANYGSTANAEEPTSYEGVFLGDTLVSADFHPTGGLPRYQRPAFAALVQGGAAVETDPPTRSVTRFVAHRSLSVGRADLVQIDSSGAIVAQPNRGDLMFDAPVSVGQSDNRVSFADLNADGREDLVQHAPDGSLIALLNRGAAAFSDPRPLGQTGNRVVLGDLDGDRRADMVQVAPDGAITVQLMGGDLELGPSVSIGQTGNQVLFATLTGR